MSLLDAAREEFGGGLRSDQPTKVAERRLLLQLPANPLPKAGLSGLPAAARLAHDRSGGRW